jgi:hypothetical protein
MKFWILFIWEHVCFCLQNLSRSEPVASGGAAARAAQTKKEKKKRMPKLEEFLQSRDYVGAMTLLDVSHCPLQVVNSRHFYLYTNVAIGNQPRMRTPNVVYSQYWEKYSRNRSMGGLLCISCRGLCQSKNSEWLVKWDAPLIMINLIF